MVANTAKGKIHRPENSTSCGSLARLAAGSCSADAGRSPERMNCRTMARRTASTPGAMNSPGQPPRSIISGAVIPAMAMPSGMPAETTAMIVARRRSGASSADSALTLGRHPPSASPVTKRQIRNSVIVSAVDVASVASPVTRQPLTISARLPNLSPSGASNAPPAPRPTSSAVNTQPKPAASSPILVRRGTANAMAAMSKPSITKTPPSRMSENIVRPFTGARPAHYATRCSPPPPSSASSRPSQGDGMR